MGLHLTQLPTGWPDSTINQVFSLKLISGCSISPKHKHHVSWPITVSSHIYKESEPRAVKGLRRITLEFAILHHVRRGSRHKSCDKWDDASGGRAKLQAMAATGSQGGQRCCSNTIIGDYQSHSPPICHPTRPALAKSIAASGKPQNTPCLNRIRTWECYNNTGEASAQFCVNSRPMYA